MTLAPFFSDTDNPSVQPPNEDLGGNTALPSQIEPFAGDPSAPPPEPNGEPAAPAAEPNAPAALTPEEAEAIRAELSQAREREAARTQAEQAAAQQAEAAEIQGVYDTTKATQFKMLTEKYGVEPAEAAAIAEQAAMARQLSHPKFLAQVQKNWEEVRGERDQHKQARAIFETIIEHFPAQTTLATLKDLVKEAQQFGSDEALLKKWATLEASNRRAANSRDRIASGAERRETGGGMGLGGESDADLLRRSSRPGEYLSGEEMARVAELQRRAGWF